jgi:hypothetical protein
MKTKLIAIGMFLMAVSGFFMGYGINQEQTVNMYSFGGITIFITGMVVAMINYLSIDY